jgi:alpha-L-fucosidase
MPVSSYYQAQPDVMCFDWRGNSIEGEFFSYEECGRDIDPKWGYIRPFDRVIRQQLIDNLQATHGIDLQTFTSQGDLITCDAFVTHKDLQAAHQVLVESFDFVDESELTTERNTSVTAVSI